ncbi:MAG: hypothetical protein ACI8PZ_004965 [Myxococcota bacterium]
MRFSRRGLLQSLGAAALLGRTGSARAEAGVAKRILFVYIPDGVVGVAEDGSPSEWHASGTEHDFVLGHASQPLAPWADRCLFLNNLFLGTEDSHEEGARMLLTGRFGGYGPSIDQLLARTVGASDPWPLLYLGAQSTIDFADHHWLSFPTDGVHRTVPPEDDPRRAFSQLFGGMDSGPLRRRRSVLDLVTADLADLRGQLGSVERSRLDLHTDALREVENRLDGLPGCDPSVDLSGITDDGLASPEAFPAILRAQTENMVLAMACGLTRVGVLQASHHTSLVLMSRFVTPPEDPAGWGPFRDYEYDAHTASHYGMVRDATIQARYAHYRAGRVWYEEQLAYLLSRLAEIPEGDGTMLDHSLVVRVSEVSDGQTHTHTNMPFLVAGEGCGTVRTGRLLDTAGGLHSDLWIALAQAMGAPVESFGDAGTQALPGVLA